MTDGDTSLVALTAARYQGRRLIEVAESLKPLREKVAEAA
jgi:hypothetical protein